MRNFFNFMLPIILATSVLFSTLILLVLFREYPVVIVPAILNSIAAAIVLNHDNVEEEEKEEKEINI